jgi:hypothetical protein
MGGRLNYHHIHACIAFTKPDFDELPVLEEVEEEGEKEGRSLFACISTLVGGR